MTGEASPPTKDSDTRRFWRMVLVHWLLIALVVAAISAGAIARQTYGDPDDILRRLEVRDLIAGQSWWDVTQYRLASGMMHWSRLVDLPLAAVILPLRPLHGELLAERVAMVVVPLVTLGCALALVAAITRRLLDAEHAGLAMLLMPLSVPIIFQMRPMRIDHHGWQVVMALVALYAALSPRATARSGIAVGLAIAALLTISLEGLPVAVLLLGLLALAWALDPTRRAPLIAAGATSFLAALALHIATRGPAMLYPACDAMSPVWLAVLGVAALSLALATLAGRLPLAARIGALALGGIACAVTLVAVQPACLAGPFSALDPLVRRFWYEKVPEGLPMWQQTPEWAFQSIALCFVGLAGTVLALRRASTVERVAWWLLLGAQVGTLLIALDVQRASATANAFALPGAAALVLTLLHRARRIEALLPRLGATAGALLLGALGLAAVPLSTMTVHRTQQQAEQRAVKVGRAPCQKNSDVDVLAALPPGRVFAPLDLAPQIIVDTSHHAIASGHHRNAAAMRDVIDGFMAAPDEARRLVADKYRADYLIGCPGADETEIYAAAAPHGLWARLEKGERFDWLQPVDLNGSPVLAWRVLRRTTPRR